MLSKEEKSRLKSVVSSTILMLCKSRMLPICTSQLNIDGVIGITVDAQHQIYIALNHVLKPEKNESEEQTTRKVTKKRKSTSMEVQATKLARTESPSSNDPATGQQKYSGVSDAETRISTPNAINSYSRASPQSETGTSSNELSQFLIMPVSQPEEQHIHHLVQSHDIIEQEQMPIAPVIVQPEEFSQPHPPQSILAHNSTPPPILSPQLPPLPPSTSTGSIPTKSTTHDTAGSASTPDTYDRAAIYGQLGQAILHSSGSFVTSRMILRSTNKSSLAIRDVMYALTVPKDHPEHIGTAVKLPDWNNMLVFYKCPPSKVKDTALLKYGLERNTYTQLFVTSNTHLSMKDELQKHIGDMTPYTTFTNIRDGPLHYQNFVPSDFDKFYKTNTKTQNANKSSSENLVKSKFKTESDKNLNATAYDSKGRPLGEINGIAPNQSDPSTETNKSKDIMDGSCREQDTSCIL